MRAQASMPSISGITMSSSTRSTGDGCCVAGPPIAKKAIGLGGRARGADILVAGGEEHRFGDVAPVLGIVDDQNMHAKLR